MASRAAVTRAAVALLLCAGLLFVVLSHSSPEPAPIMDDVPAGSVSLAGKEATGKEPATAAGKEPAKAAAKVVAKAAKAPHVSKAAKAMVPHGKGAKSTAAKVAKAAEAAAEVPRGSISHHAAKRLAKQAEMREAYDEERERTLEALGETQRFRNVIVTVLALIVTLSVAFEVGTGAMIKSADSHLRPILHVLFKELTVLGFISLMVFMALKTGFPEHLSREIFGTPSELVEIFDEVHIILFLIVVMYIGLVCTLMYHSGHKATAYQTAELLAYRRSLGESLRAADAGMCPMADREYLLIRHRFLNPPTRTVHDPAPFFDFSSYLLECTSETFVELVELEPPTWGVMMVLLIFARMYMMIPSETAKLIVFIGIGFLLVVVFRCIRNKLRVVKAALTSFGAIDGAEAGKSGTPPYLTSAPAPLTPGTLSFNLAGKKQANRHQALFWFGGNGPAFVLHVVRTTLFFVSVYFALLVFRFGDDLDAATACLFVLALASPLYVIWVLAPEVVSLLVLCTSIEMCKRWELIKCVEAAEVRKRSAAVKKIVGTLRSKSRLLRKKRGVSPSASATASKAAVADLSPERVDELREAYGLLDPHGLDRVQGVHLVALFRSAGIHLPAAEVADVLMEMDFNGDGDIAFSEFCTYVSNMGQTTLVREMLDDLFKFFDSENHGSVSVEQLRDGLCRMNSTISSQDVYDWIDPSHERSERSLPLSYEEFVKACGSA